MGSFTATWPSRGRLGRLFSYLIDTCDYTPPPGICQGTGFVPPLRLQYFRKLGQGVAAGGGDHHDILDPDASLLRVVQSGLDGHDVAALESRPPRPDPGWFVHLEPEPMPGAVEKSLHPSARLPRGKAQPVEERGDLLMDRGPLGPIPDEGHRPLLCLEHRLEHLPHARRGMSLDDRAGDVAEILGPARAGEDIDHDGPMGRPGPPPPRMRITPLLAPGPPRVLRR